MQRAKVHILSMTLTASPLARWTRLADRALIRVRGAEARGFLNGLLTQAALDLGPGELRFAAWLSPQGRLLHDVMLWGRDDGVILDVAASDLDTLAAKLKLHKLRAKVEIEPMAEQVSAAWGASSAPDPDWRADPRRPELGWRALDAAPPPGFAEAEPDDYRRLRRSLAVAETAADGLGERFYPLEVNFDLLHGVDFKKGCFVGQETTSRMKRRGTLKSRTLCLAFEGPPPAPGTAVMNVEMRAGEVLAAEPGLALALMRLDRLEGGVLSIDGAPARVPPEMAAFIAGS
jgi:tRNA-modifying protein YgfZ